MLSFTPGLLIHSVWMGKAENMHFYNSKMVSGEADIAHMGTII